MLSREKSRNSTEKNGRHCLADMNKAAVKGIENPLTAALLMVYRVRRVRKKGVRDFLLKHACGVRNET